MDRARYVAANRAAWEASAPLHRRGASWQRLAEGFARPGFSCLDAVETEALTREGVAGKAVAQLCCNNARELLSVKSMGAGRCVGFDQADAFLEQGRELAEIAGLELELVSGDVYAVPARFDAAFEIVLVTIGVFGWLPDFGRQRPETFNPLTPFGFNPLVWGYLGSVIACWVGSRFGTPDPELVRKYFPEKQV